MSAVVADTHAVVWYLTEPGLLSANAVSALDHAVVSGEPIRIAAITLVEVVYLVEKGRLRSSVLQAINDAVDAPAPTVVAVSLDIVVARSVASIPRAVVPDMPDRIIAATALASGLPLVTRDTSIQASGIPTIW